MAFSLNSSNSFFTTVAPVTGYPFSLAGWFRVPNVSASISLTGLVSLGTGARCDVIFAGDAGKEAVAKTVNGGSASAVSSIAMVPGQWHHLVAVFAADDDRKVYLDGAIVGTNTDSISVGALDFYYFGNINSTDVIDVADISLVEAALDAQQASALAQGLPVVASTRNVLAYQDCIRYANRPGFGVSLTSTGGVTIIDHPRMMLAGGGNTLMMPDRVKGPMRVEQAQYRSLSAIEGQPAIAGIISTNSILPGEVIS